MTKLLLSLALTLVSCRVTSSEFSCLRDADYERPLMLAHKRGVVTLDELLKAFDATAEFSPYAISMRVHDDERGCVCCITFDLEPLSSGTYRIKSIYVFYSAPDREAMLKNVDQLIALWAPDNARAEQTVFPSGAGTTKERRIYVVGDEIWEASIDTYTHHGIWTASINLFTYSVTRSDEEGPKHQPSRFPDYSTPTTEQSVETSQLVKQLLRHAALLPRITVSQLVPSLGLEEHSSPHLWWDCKTVLGNTKKND